MSIADIIKMILEAILGGTKPLPQPNPQPPPNPPPPNPSDFANRLLQLHNNHRNKLGKPSLKLNTSLNSAAQKHTAWMNTNQILSHYENGNNPGDRIKAEGYKWTTYGENIAMGYSTPEAVFQGWLNSSGHKANIENAQFKDVGFGNVGKYWTTVFAASSFFSNFIGLPDGIENQENYE